MKGATIIDKFRAESETDSQQTMKTVGQYGRVSSAHWVSPWSPSADVTGAEAEGQKRFEVTYGPSLSRTLESGGAGEMKAGGDDSNATIDGALVGGLTVRRDGQYIPAFTGKHADCTTWMALKNPDVRLGSETSGEHAVGAGASFAGGGGHGDPQRREGSLSEVPHCSDTGTSLVGPVQRMELGAGSTPAHQQPIKPQRVRFGPGAVPISETAWQRKEWQQEAYYDAMQADVTGAYQWPTRECAGGCGRNVSGPWDKCLRCGSRDRHELEHEEMS